MTIEPQAEIAERFGVRLAGELGGRLNRHWLAEAGGAQKAPRLVLRRWWQPAASVDYEMRLLERLAALGWPVAPVVAGPAEAGGALWTLMPFLPGEPPPTGEPAANPAAEQRARGRLLAALHADLGQIDLGQRPGWRRCEDILADQELDRLLARIEPAYQEEAPIVRWHLERARERIAGLRPRAMPGLINHGDFTAWNLRFRDGRLSGVLDFELAHWDHRIGDFALAWRGKYDEVIRGYREAAPLEPEELALLTPMWWAYLVEVFCNAAREGVPEDGWVVKKLLERSPLMGPDAAPFR